ncbi:hypothetical protein F0562_008642 [Nyssa sinensis]|uniref:F-box domain-containing protein n=1 Tax=Nyssa sinensis TaxID=561372 RepID=A0A5J5AA19_9ASTE|nr:hypothetical protein F0562_008642 [Nyssa sinensis]
MKAGESVNDYFGRTLIIANKMRIHGERMEDVVIIEKILRSMTSKYDYVVCSIEESNDLDALSIDELQSSLLVHEQRISRHAVVDEQALQVTYGAQQGGRGTYGAQQEGRGGGRSTYRGRGRGRGRFGHKQAILADLEWEKDEETSTEEESNGEESEVDRNMEENGSNDSESLIEEDASDVNNSPPEGRPRRPPTWMRDYETGQGLSDEEGVNRPRRPPAWMRDYETGQGLSDEEGKMTMLLRKVWESVSSRSSSNSNSYSSYNRREQMMHVQSSTGAFDRLPLDIFMLILKLLGPKEVAKLSVVCKSWKLIVSDNPLWIFFLQNHRESWDSIFFAETHLRSGFPLLCDCRAFPNQKPPLSFMHIYGQREQVPGSVIIDGGSGYCKYGWSKCASPSGRATTFLEFGNIETPMSSKLRNFFVTIYSRMQVKKSAHPIVVSIPICHYEDTESAKAARRQLKEAIYTTLFNMNVPAVCAINQATLALYAARQTSGIVVNIGFHQTSVVPILHGKIMRKVGVEVVGMGALKLTGFLRDLMQQKNIKFESLYTLHLLKENLCYVALDYESELSKDTQASFEVEAEGCFNLSEERFQTGEILFQPRIAGVRAMGLQQAVALCMDHCQAAELTGDDGWYKTVVLAGGTACLPGLAERLEKELQGILSPSVFSGIRIIPPHEEESAWSGAKLVSNLSTFPDSWCITKKQFRHKSRRSLIW